MGTQSTTTPIHERARPLPAICQCIARYGAAIGLAVVFAGSTQAQTPAAQPLLLPSAIVFDAQGNLYFADTGNHIIREYSVAGVLTTFAGSGVEGYSGDNGPATAAELDSPEGLALDAAENLYIADSHNHCIREVAATGMITTVAGTGVAGFSGDEGQASAAQFDLPTALAFDSTGNLYVADTDNHRIRRIAVATSVITTVAGNGVEAFAGDNGPATAASIDSPNGLALDPAGNLYIADTHNGRVREVNAATRAISTIAGGGFTAGNVQAFGGDGGAATAAGLALPRGLTIDAAGNLYVADSANQRIRRISTSGTITTIAGQGTEAFAGDGAPAVAASLDTPRAVAVSPAGLLTLADTENQRIRQLDALPAPGPDIHTIPWSVGTTLETLSLSGPSLIPYGSGTLGVTLTSASPVTGSVTFQDTSGGAMITLGTAPLAANGAGAEAASFSTAGLSAGAHSIVAIYAGDANHAAAQSSVFALTVTPLGIVATPDPASILYGQAIPVLTGVLTGVLPQDAGKVSAAFNTNAVSLSPVGLYPIAAALSGSAAGNYTVALTPASLTITQAPTLTAFSVSAGNPSLGLPVTITVHAASTTSGVPTGSVTLLDGTSLLSPIPLAAGSAVFTTSALALGTHSLTAAYSGDTNFLPSTSGTQNIVVVAASDFSLTATGVTSQSVPAGNAATFSFSVATTGPALSSPIALAVLGVPVGATASISPSSLPPGGAVTSFTLTIQTPLARLNQPSLPIHPNLPGSGLLALLVLPGIGFVRRFSPGPRRRLPTTFLVAALGILSALLATGCGDRINVASESVNATSYTLTVTGTATSPTGTALQHSVNVTLEVL
jgi:sugar lactone lactonase YvrE